MNRLSCGGTCGRPIISAVVVTCTGPCRKRFHPECAGFWNLSVDQLSYLLWFCDPCQQELPMSRIALQRVVQQLCWNPADAVVVELPEEVLEMIFRHLNYCQLAQVRRTCHRWKAVVDGSTVLSRKFCIKFPQGIMLDRDYEPSCLPSAVEAVKLCRARIVAVDPWWSSLGEKLVEITLNNCIVSVTRMASMLQQAPNLKSIELDCLDVGAVMNEWYHGATVANFQMNQMEKLVLHQCARTIRNLLVSVCTRLVTFHGDYDDDELLLYLEKWHNTLQSIFVIPSEDMLAALCHISLQLTDLCLVCNIIQSYHVIPFLQRLQNLKRLKLIGIKLVDTVLREIGNILPDLAVLVVEINREGEGWDMSFLNAMPNLEQFRVIPEHIPNQEPNGITELMGVSFYGCRSPKLQELELSCIEFECEDFSRFVKEAPNLHTVTLTSLSLDTWSEIFETLPMTKLRSLTLSAITSMPNKFCDSLVEYYDNLRCLKLDKVSMCVQTLRALFRLSPGLEVVSLHSLDSLDDSAVLMLSQKVKRLADLTISACPISDATIWHIIQNCTALDRLDIQNCSGLTQAVQGMIVGSWLNEVMFRVFFYTTLPLESSPSSM